MGFIISTMLLPNTNRKSHRQNSGSLTKFQKSSQYSVPQNVMGWLLIVRSLELQVSFAKEPYKIDDILQKRPIILRSLLIVATPYVQGHYRRLTNVLQKCYNSLKLQVPFAEYSLVCRALLQNRPIILRSLQTSYKSLTNIFQKSYTSLTKILQQSYNIFLQELWRRSVVLCNSCEGLRSALQQLCRVAQYLAEQCSTRSTGLVGSLELQVSFAKEPYKRNYILRSNLLSSALRQQYYATLYNSCRALHNSYRSLLQNIVSFIGLFCKREL